MRILLCSNWFSPSIGGVETVSKILADEFIRAGESVTVVTNTPGPESQSNYPIVRRPSYSSLIQLGRKSDLIFQNHISLRTLIPLLPCRKPVAIAHQSWLRRSDGRRGFENYTKLLLLRTAANMAISQSIAKDLPVYAEVIGNPFEASEFQAVSDRPRNRDLVFMGRLVSDKGCDVLLQALGMLKTRGLAPSLTIIGDGPEMALLKAMAGELRIMGQLEFMGSVRQGRGAIVAQHRIMVVPSRWSEPFGIVVLEGISAGCAIVASAQGGLMEAVGPCGISFPNGDAAGLAAALERMLTDSMLLQDVVAKGPRHLRAFQPAFIAQRYLDVFRRAISA